MDLGLKNTRAPVTAASRGVGRACVGPAPGTPAVRRVH
jgi:hypothetical protein